MLNKSTIVVLYIVILCDLSLDTLTKHLQQTSSKIVAELLTIRGKFASENFVMHTSTTGVHSSSEEFLHECTFTSRTLEL